MLKVYYTRTQYSPWTIHDLFNELSIYLKKQFNAIIYTQIGGHVYVPEFDYHIGDCELIIYDDQKDALSVVSFSETKTPILDILQNRSKSNDILVVLHQLSWRNFLQNNASFKIKKTSFYPFSPKINYNYYYNLRKLKNYSDLIDKMFFRTTTGRGDEKRLSDLGLINDLFFTISFDDYLNLAITYKIGLSISGGSYELCHRDFDYMAIGLPLLRLEFIDTYDPELIPNHHYISVSRKELGYDSYADLRGGNNYIDAYRHRFLEVKDNYEFLDYISNNARLYYENFCSPNTKLKHLLNKLELI